MKKFALTLFFVIGLDFSAAELCPNKRDTCPDSTICCQLISGSYGCCPYVAGICCDDKIHCCPDGTSCNVERESCDGKSLPVSFKWMVPVYNEDVVSVSIDDAIEEEEQSTWENNYEVIGNEMTKCPNGGYCAKGETCCNFGDLQHYGCCPFEQATCCGDLRHCCPHDYACDVKSARCISKAFLNYEYSPQPRYLPLSNIRDKLSEVADASSAPFPISGESLCSNGEKLCPLDALTEFGCCIYPNASCCNDMEHCCPHDTICDLKKMRCVKKSFEISGISATPQYTPIFNIKLNEFEVPNVISKCSFGYCKDSNAVCCSEKGFCCPVNSVCSKTGCLLHYGPNKFVRGTPIIPRGLTSFRVNPFKVEAPIICPDQKEACPSGDTCCISANKTYLCCSLSQATCCDDKLHCCPNGYACTDLGCVRKPFLNALHEPFLIAKTPIIKKAL